MRYVPASCSKCKRTALVPLEPRARVAACAACGGPATFLPGASYSEDETSEFVELRCIVDDAQLDHDEGLQLLDALLLTSPSEMAFERAIELLPKLAAWRRSWGDSPVRLLRGLEILRTVLSGVVVPDGPTTVSALAGNSDRFSGSAGQRPAS